MFVVVVADLIVLGVVISIQQSEYAGQEEEKKEKKVLWLGGDPADSSPNGSTSVVVSLHKVSRAQSQSPGPSGASSAETSKGNCKKLRCPPH